MGGLDAKWSEWIDTLDAAYLYPRSQIAAHPVGDLLGVYRDSSFTRCLALIRRGRSSKRLIEELAPTAVAAAAEYVLIGSAKSHRTYLVTPYGLEPSPHLLPSWSRAHARSQALSRRHQLPPFRDEDEARRAFSAIHDALYQHEAKDPAAAFDAMTLVIAAKILDETQDTETYRFRVPEDGKPKTALARLERLIADAAHWLGGDAAPTRIAPAVAMTVLETLQDFGLVATSDSPSGTDILGLAYERIVGATFRGELGSYFTPRNITDFIVRLLDVRGGAVCDPACGSGGFLLACDRHHRNHGGRGPLHLFGNDLNPRMVRAARLNMISHRHPAERILGGNGLDLPSMVARWFDADFDGPAFWDASAGHFDFILANPPFAGHEGDDGLLSHIATAVGKDGRPRALNRTLPFIEVITALLKPGGRAGLVLPTSILNAEETSFVRLRRALLERAKILAIVGLPEKAFVHTDCGIHGALLFFERCRRPPKSYDVFVSTVERLGYDKLGRPTRDSELPAVLERFRSGRWRRGERVSVADLVEQDRWDPKWLSIYESLPKKGARGFVRLSELVEVRKARWSRRGIDDDGLYRYFEVADCDVHTGEVTNVNEVKGYELRRKGRISIQVAAGDILLPNHRDSLIAASAKHGRSAVMVDAELDGVLTTNRFLVLRPRADPQLVLTLLNSPLVRRQLVARCRGAASLDIREHLIDEVMVPKRLTSKETVGRVRALAKSVARHRQQVVAKSDELDALIEGR